MRKASASVTIVRTAPRRAEDVLWPTQDCCGRVWGWPRTSETSPKTDQNPTKTEIPQDLVPPNARLAWLRNPGRLHKWFPFGSYGTRGCAVVLWSTHGCCARVCREPRPRNLSQNRTKSGQSWDSANLVMYSRCPLT